MIHRRRSTPPGQHLPVLLEQVLEVLAPQPGELVADCTIGWASHAAELLRRVGTEGKLIGIDFDAENLSRAQQHLESINFPFTLHQGNFAGLPTILASLGLTRADKILADLGMSSMQVDDPGRGFSYRRDGPLDMRMDRSRGRTAAQILAGISEAELARAIRDFGDDPEASRIAASIVAARSQRPIERTGDLVRAVMDATRSGKAGEWQLHPERNRWEIHPAARTFQALRILVNRELANLEQLLRVLPHCLQPGGRAAIISFHSGEDRLVKSAFRSGLEAGIYSAISPDPVRASFAERAANPRARSGKLRWARRNDESQMGRPPMSVGC
jgi:16S rRNA (cytosine1402-N4)-methyltransferase